MEVQFTPEQEAQISQIASYNGTPAEQLVKQAALRLVEEDAAFRGCTPWHRTSGSWRVYRA
jgi:hypothetical protein